MEDLTLKQIKQINEITRITKQVGLGTKLQAIIDELNAGLPGPQGEPGPVGDPGPVGVYTAIEEGTPVNAVNAGKILTISGPVLDGETVTIDNPSVEGSDIYEFAADVALSVGVGNIPVDINAYTVKATNGLTVDVNPTPGDKMTIGSKTFTFVPLGTANGDGEIDVEVLLDDTQLNIIAAITGTDHNDPHPQVTCGEAFLSNVLAITALVGGAAGNTIGTTETFAIGTNEFSADALANGGDCSAADGVTALVAAITDYDTQGVGAADGEGNIVELLADIAGADGNSIVIGEDMSGAAFADDAVLLSGGVNGIVGEARSAMVDANFLYVCVADNTTVDKNWRRVSLGEAYFN